MHKLPLRILSTKKSWNFYPIHNYENLPARL
jgi:hypothetical protein